jgi:hypothetical protein
VHHEGDTLRRRQGLQHDQQREPDRIGQHRLLLRGTRRHRLGRMFIQHLFPARLARTQHVEADPGHHRRQPAAKIGDLAGVAAAKPQPGFLHGIVGLGRRAQHAVGDPLKVATVGLEAICQKFLLIHRHIPSSRFVISLTAQTRPM